MACRMQWLAMSALVICVGMLAGCSSVPDFALPKESLALNLTEPILPRVGRAQMSDKPVTIQKPAGDVPAVIPPPPGVIQTNANLRGTVRVSVRAWVNGRPIFDDEVMQMAGPDLRRVLSFPEPTRSEKMAELYNSVLDSMIDQEVIYQDAVKRLEKLNPTGLEKLKGFVDEEFDKQLTRMRAANVTEEQIREMEPAARRILERNLVAGEFARSRIKPILDSRIGLTEIREYYDEHKNEFKTVNKVAWLDVFIPLNANQPTLDELKRFAEEMLNRCRSVEDFKKLMVYNEGDSKLRNGEGLGARRGEIRPADLEEHLFALREGEFGPVIPFTTGVHLICVTKREYTGQLPLNDETQKAIRKKLEMQLFEREYRRIVRELKTRAIIRLERDS